MIGRLRGTFPHAAHSTSPIPRYAESMKFGSSFRRTHRAVSTRSGVDLASEAPPTAPTPSGQTARHRFSTWARFRTSGRSSGTNGRRPPPALTSRVAVRRRRHSGTLAQVTVRLPGAPFEPTFYDRSRGRVRPARLRRPSAARDAAVRARAARARAQRAGLRRLDVVDGAHRGDARVGATAAGRER